MKTSLATRMPLVPALEVLLPLRQEQIVVTTMGAAREWELMAHSLHKSAGSLRRYIRRGCLFDRNPARCLGL